MKDIMPGAQNSLIQSITNIDDEIYFAASNLLNQDVHLWKTDGTSETTQPIHEVSLKQNAGYSIQFKQFNDNIYFAGDGGPYYGLELWKTNGTALSTQFVADLNHTYSVASVFSDFGIFNDKLVFSGTSGGAEREPHITDGTSSGTFLLKNINVSTNSVSMSTGFRPRYLQVGNQVFFKASESNDVNFELYKTDGTTANTGLVKDIFPFGNGLPAYSLFINYNNVLYFRGDDGIHGSEFWRSDGTEVGTYMVKDFITGSGDGVRSINEDYLYDPSMAPKCYATINGKLYFSAFDNDTIESIWETDGTEAGTLKVIEIPQNNSQDWRRPILGSIGNKLFFTTNVSSTNNSLWISDGTQEGTNLLGTYATTGNSANFRRVIIHNEELFFTHGASAYLLSKVNTEGEFTSIVPSGAFPNNYSISTLRPCGNDLYFLVGSSNLFRSNGSADNFFELDGSANGTTGIRGCQCDSNGTFLYVRNYNENKIWYVLPGATQRDFLDVNVVNGANFGSSTGEGIKDLLLVGEKLLLLGNTRENGTELYSLSVESLLGNTEFNTTTADTHFTLFPNPTSAEFKIQSPDQEIIESVDIFEMSAKILFTKKGSERVETVDISDLPAGTYLVRIKSNSLTETKIVVKN